MIVVDASAMLEVLLRTSAAEAVERRLFDSRQTMHAAHLIDVEVAQVIRRYAATRELDADRGRAALADLVDFPLRRYPHDLLLPRVWELRNNLTAYDAVDPKALAMPFDHCRRFDEHQGAKDPRPHSVKILRDGRRRSTVPDFATPVA